MKRLLLILMVASACGRNDEAAPPPPGAAPAPVGETPSAFPELGVAEDSLPLETAVQDRTGIDTLGAATPRTPTIGPATSPPTGAGAVPRPAAQSPAEPSTPQDQNDGATILRSAAAAYANVRSMRADFVMTFSNRLLRTEMTGRGTLFQQRPDRIALRFTDPAGEVMLSDGTHFYIYQPGVNPGQAIRTPAGSGTGGVDLQAQFVGEPTERFEYSVDGRENVGGRPANVLTLTPRQRAEYRSLKVWVDVRDSLVRRFEITEHNGSVRRFDLSGLQTNVPVAESVFRFVPPQGVRIIDP